MRPRARGLAARMAAALALALGAGCAATAGEQAAVPTAVDGAARSVWTDLRGRDHDVDAELAAGRSVAFVFWQPWCGACEAEAPAANLAASRPNLRVLGVVSGPTGPVDESLVQQSILDWGITYPTIRDRDLRLTRALDVQVAPAIVIVDPSGSVVDHADVPPAEWLE